MITINDIKTSLQTEHMQLETDNEDTIVKMKDSGKKIWIGSNINMASSDEITEAILETLNALADNPEYEKDLKIIECEIKYPRVIPLMTTAITETHLQKAIQVLIDSGIEDDEADTVLQALGYVLLDTELFPEGEETTYTPERMLTIGIEQLHADLPYLLDVMTQENEGIYGYTINFTAYREEDKWNVVGYYLYPQNGDSFEQNEDLFPGLNPIFAKAAAMHANVIHIVLDSSAIIDGCPLYK